MLFEVVIPVSVAHENTEDLNVVFPEGISLWHKIGSPGSVGHLWPIFYT